MTSQGISRRAFVAAGVCVGGVGRAAEAATPLLFVERWQWTHAVKDREPEAAAPTQYRRGQAEPLYLWMSLGLTPEAVNLLQQGRDLPVFVQWRKSGVVAVIRARSPDIGIRYDAYRRSANGIYFWRTYAQFPDTLSAGAADAVVITGGARPLRVMERATGAPFQPSIQIS